MNDKYSTTEGKTSEKLSDEAMLSAQWKNIDWHKAEREVNRLQIRIVKATQQKDYNAELPVWMVFSGTPRRRN